MKSQKIPDKMAYSIDEVSRITKIAPEIIDAWENELYFLHAGQTGTGVKIFRKKDLTIILRLKELLEKEELTLAGAKRRIEEEFGIKTSIPVHPDRLKKVLYRVKDQLQEIASSLDKKSEKI